MKILVTYAVQGEFTELKFPGMWKRRSAGGLSAYRHRQGEVCLLPD